MGERDVCAAVAGGPSSDGVNVQAGPELSRGVRGRRGRRH